MNSGWLKYLPQIFRRHLDGRYDLQKAIGNAWWLLVDKVLRLGIGFIVAVWMVRYLGPLQYGLYSFAVAFVALFSAFANLGLDSVVIRDIVKDQSRSRELLGTAFVLKFSGAVLTTLSVVVLILALRPGDWLSFWLVLLAAGGFLFQSFDTIDLWFQAMLQSRFAVWAKNVAFLIATLAKVWLILSGAPLIAFAAVGLVEIILGAVGLLIAYRLNQQMFARWRFSPQIARNLLRESWPLLFSGLAITLYMRIDQIMLGQMKGDIAVGHYAAAVRISEIWYFIPMIIVASATPALIQAKQAGGAIYLKRLGALFGVTTLLSYGITIPIFLLSDSLIEALFGPAFQEAGSVLKVLIWTTPFVALGVASSQYLLIEGLNNIALQRTLVGAGLNVLLNLVWIPPYGALGSAWATLLSYSVPSLWLIWNPKTTICLKMMVRSLFPLRYFSVAIKPTLVTIFEGVLPSVARLWKNMRILMLSNGQWKSIRTRRPVDRDGHPIPWYTYPCIEYLCQFDFRSLTVFEFGAGNSSFFWAERAATVISVEKDPKWFQYVDEHKKPNQQVYLRTDRDSYVSSLEEQGRLFDVIAIDGSWREACVKAASDHVAHDGIILLDNADRHAEAVRCLRQRGFFEIDFSGFGPTNGYTWTTSIFIKAATTLQRNFSDPHPQGGLEIKAGKDD